MGLPAFGAANGRSPRYAAVVKRWTPKWLAAAYKSDGAFRFSLSVALGLLVMLVLLHR